VAQMATAFSVYMAWKTSVTIRRSLDIPSTEGNRIGVARLDLPDLLPVGVAADPPEARV